MNPIPKLTDAEASLLRESIRRDGVQYPVLLDASGAVIDGHHRKQLCAELGIDCPTRIIGVDAETAERLAVTLNLARRQLNSAAQYDLIAWLAERHEADARSAALDRMAEGGQKGVPVKGSTSVVLPLKGTKAAADIAERINTDLKAGGESLRVSKSKVERAQKWKRASEADKAAVRDGRKTVTDVVSPGHKNWPSYSQTRPKAAPAKRTSKREPKRQIHNQEQLDALARVRATDAELQYQSMLNAPAGKTNLPFIRRAEQIQILLHDLFEMPVEKAVTFVHPERLPEFSFRDRADWWLEFTELCEKRWHTELPDLPQVPPTRWLPLAERDLGRGDLTMLGWLRTKIDPITAIEAAVALRISQSRAGQQLKALTEADLAEVVGLVGKRLAYTTKPS